MEKPLYILVFLLLWSTRIKGGEEEDINVTVSPSAQKNEVRNSYIVDKASTSQITKTATIFDPDSESSETESPPIKSKALETNTDTPEPFSPDSVTSKPARDSTTANTTTLSDPDSDSSETQSPPIKPEAPKTTNESSETNSPPIKSEAPETKPGTPEPSLPNSVTPKSARDSTTVKTTQSDPDSDSPETQSPPIKSEAPKSTKESTETDSASIKTEAPETKIASTTAKTKTTPIRDLDSGTQQPSIHNFESHEPANASTTANTKTTTMGDADLESSETDLPHFKSEAPEFRPSSTAKAKTATISDPNSDNPEPSIITFEIHQPSKELSVTDLPPIRSEAQETKTASTTSTKIISDSESEASEVKSTFLKSKTSKTTTVDLRRLPRSSDEERDLNERSKTNTLSAELGTLRSTRDIKRRISKSSQEREVTEPSGETESPVLPPETPEVSSGTTGPVRTSTDLETAMAKSEFTPLNCLTNKKEYLENQTNTSITLRLSSFGNRSDLCLTWQSNDEDSLCTPFNTFSDKTISDLHPGSPYNFSVESIKNNTGSNHSCLLGLFYTLPRYPECNEYGINTIVTTRTYDSLTLNTTQLANDSCIMIGPQQTNNSDGCIPATHSLISFQNLTSSKPYEVFIFSYLNVSDETTVYSPASCLLGKTYTLPSNPECSTIQKKIQHRDSTSIVLKITQFSNSTVEKLCIQQNGTCTSTSELGHFSGLNPSTAYNFPVFSYVDELEKPSVRWLSRLNCSFLVFTRPNKPNCTALKTVTATKRTASMITLDFTPLSKPWLPLCVKMQSNMTCTPLKYPTMRFDQLNVSTRYNFSVFSYVNDTEEKQLLRSTNSCTFSHYTGPNNPDCGSILIRNKTTNSMVLEVKNITSFGYIALILKGSEWIKNITLNKTNEFFENVTSLESGTSYTFDLFAVNYQNIKSVNGCRQDNQYTYPGQPTKLENFTVFKAETEFGVRWNPPTMGSVDKYNITVQCNCSTCCSCSPNFNSSVKETTVNVTGLHAGTDCSVQVRAILGNLSSVPLEYRNIETKEKAPGNVSNVNVTDISSSGFTISWSKPTNPNGHILEYNVTITGKKHEIDKSETVEISRFPLKMTYNNLSPGNCYYVTIAAVNGAGEGKKITVNIYTAEKVPSQVFNLTATNTTSTSIEVTWFEPQHPNGVITQYQISVEKEKEEKNTKQINFYCMDCQRPCPKPDFSNKGDIKAGIPKHDVNITRSNKTLKYEITKLQKFTVYTISVKAFTAIGGGNEKTIHRRTSEDKPSPPGQPVNLTVHEYNVSFVYNKPNETNGIITNQEIEYTFMPYNMCTGNQNVVEPQKMYLVSDNPHKFSASLKKLKPFWSYTIRVRVSTSAGFSNYSESTTFRTLPTTPGNVSDITAENISSRHIYLSWTQPCHPNGIITNYTIEITNKNDSSNFVNDTRFTNNNSTSFNVTNLLPYCLYQFNVYTQVQNVSNLSEPTTSTTFHTKTEAPYRPGRFTHKNYTSTSVTLSWKTPDLKTGPTNYLVKAIDNVTFALAGSCETSGFHNTTCIITGLDSYWKYLLTVEAIVENFPANKSTDYDGVRTDQSAPGRVSNFTVIQDSNVTAKTNVLIEWSPPSQRNLNGIIKNYFLQYWYQLNQIETNSYDSTQWKATILVEAEKTYTFQIFAMTIENATDIVTKSLTIEPGAPLPPPTQKIPLINKGPPASDDQTQIAVAFRRIALCDDSNGKIVKWYIIVSKTPERQVFRGTKNEYLKKIEKSYKKWEDVYEKDVNDPYIASDTWNPHCGSGSRRKRSATLDTIGYTLGSDGDCESGNRKYCNGNLEPGQTYRVRYAVCTKGGCLESEFSEPFQTAPNHIPAIAGSLTAVVLVLAVIIVVIIILKRRGKGPFKSLDNGEVGQQNEAFAGVEMKGASKPKAVKIADFANYVQKLHADSNLLFSSEYKLLKETCPTHTTKAAEVQVNRIKNRYTNILSYDHSRVKLLPTEDDEGSDYINANYMPGYTSPREYIATQGPLPFTRDDFWRMIWEQNVSIIVMLTQLVERGRRKCDIYWPEAAREPVYYGDLVVELESESTLPDYVLRVMSIKLGDTRKTIKQFAYLAWPDMGIPETSEAMLKFAKEVRSHLPPPATSKGPMVVHCSAGVGRTGTFIAVDYLMQHVRTSDVIDIYSYVMKMRNNRPNMVQTEDQYVFIHDCIKDYVNKNDDDTDDEEEEEEKQEDQSIYMNV